MSHFTRKRNAMLFVRLFVLTAGLVTGLILSKPATAQTNDVSSKHFVAPTVFQAAGPSAASIQSTVDQFRAALGVANNGNNPGLTSGHREINWDGGSPTNAATTLSGTPLTAFLNTRGANITTRGSGFIQAPPSGLADTFGNSSYATIFHAFSPLRLFSPIGSNVTESSSPFRQQWQHTSDFHRLRRHFYRRRLARWQRSEGQDRKPSRQHCDRVLRHPRRVAFHERRAGFAG